MSFSEQPPSKQWAALTFRGQRFAEVWFKPDGEPWALRFRIPQESFQIPGLGPRLTAENLLKAVAIRADEVESCHEADDSPTAPNRPPVELGDPLPQPPPGAQHLEIYVRLKRPQAAGGDESDRQAVDPAKWQELESRWRTVLGLEATIDTLRISMESLRLEMESTMKRSLAPDEKLHALAADVVQWNKAKSRIHFAVPKARDFVHRATWAKGTPEWKRLDELFKTPMESLPPDIQTEQVAEELEHLRKDRQVLSGLGTTVYQDCKGVVAEVQAALRRLQGNAAARAVKKRGATDGRGKSF